MRGRPAGPAQPAVAIQEQRWPQATSLDPRLRDLGVNLSRLRFEAGLTRHALAKAAGVSSHILKGLEYAEGKDPRTSTLLKLCDGLNLTSVDQLFEAKDSWKS